MSIIEKQTKKFSHKNENRTIFRNYSDKYENYLRNLEYLKITKIF